MSSKRPDGHHNPLSLPYDRTLQQWSKYLAQLVMYIPVIDKKVSEISEQYFQTGDPLY